MSSSTTGPSEAAAQDVRITDEALVVELVEDISVEDLLAGRASGERQESLRRWLDAREEDG